MRKTTCTPNIQKITWIKEHDLAKHVKTEQVTDRAIVGGEGLGESGREREAGEHLHQVGVCAVQAQGETAEGGECGAGV